MRQISSINGQKMQIKNNITIKEKQNGQVNRYRFTEELDRCYKRRDIRTDKHL